MAVVMVGIDAKHVFKLAAAEDEQPVEALATDAADPALGVGVRVRCLDGRTDHGHSFATEDVIETAAELGVAIVDQEAERLPAIIERHQQVACLLGDPGACRVGRAGDELEATQALRQVLARAVVWGMIDVNPAKHGVDNPQRRRTEKRPFESWAELDAVAAQLAPRYGPMVIFAAATGLRPANGSRSRSATSIARRASSTSAARSRRAAQVHED